MDNDSRAVVPVKKDKFKIVLLGNARVGKTSFLTRYFFNNFSSNYNATLAAETHQDKANGALIDVCGKSLEESDPFLEMYISKINEVNAFLVFYDITSRASFEQISAIVHKIRGQYPDNTPPIILVGTKSDLETNRQVSNQEAVALNGNLHCNGVFEVSSATGQNVNKVMAELNRQMMAKANPQKERLEGNLPNTQAVKNPKEKFVIDYEKLRELDYLWDTTQGDKKAKILAILKDYTKFNY